eukprot:11661472-Ditylum_brightwellii.AAC.2
MDHQRSSSKLCKAQKKIPTQSEEGMSHQKKKRWSKSKEDRSSIKFDDGISMSYFINVGSTDDTLNPVTKVSNSSFISRPSTCKLIFDTEYGGKETREPIAKHLMSKYFPFYIIAKFVRASNKCHLKRKEQYQHLWIWTSNFSSEVTNSNIYNFITLVYYMGICKLPSKRDYWSTHKYMPSHSITTKFGMTWDHFNFIWQHFHVQSDSEHYQADIH